MMAAAYDVEQGSRSPISPGGYTAIPGFSDHPWRTWVKRLLALALAFALAAAVAIATSHGAWKATALRTAGHFFFIEKTAYTTESYGALAPSPAYSDGTLAPTPTVNYGTHATSTAYESNTYNSDASTYIIDNFTIPVDDSGAYPNYDATQSPSQNSMAQVPAPISTSRNLVIPPHTASMQSPISEAAFPFPPPIALPAPAQLATHPSRHIPTEIPITTSTITSTTIEKTALFCFALMQPKGYEVALLKALETRKESIFACDKHTIFSSTVIHLSPDTQTEDIGSVECAYGGKYYLALNTAIFVRVFGRVFSDGQFKHYDWTVKVDPDAVFLPSRLHAHVKIFNPAEPVYLNNCDHGLHGPIEVISRGGMERFNKGIEHCRMELKHEWNETGEDVFVRHCMSLLNVNKVDDFKLLSEDHCFHEKPAEGCKSGKVAFHPFKTPETYFKCLSEAKNSEMAAVKFSL